MSDPSPKIYDFDQQINLLQDILQTNITLAENANIFFHKMSPILIKQAVKDLKYKYEEKYYKNERQLYNKINLTLNLLVSERITTLDQDFMELGFMLNYYYGQKYLKISKKFNYSLYCKHCLKYVTNYSKFLVYHENQCPKNQNRQRRNYKFTERKQGKQGKHPKKSPFVIGTRFNGKTWHDNSLNFDHFDDKMIYIKEKDDNRIHIEEEEGQQIEKVKIEAQSPFFKPIQPKKDYFQVKKSKEQYRYLQDLSNIEVKLEEPDD